MLFFGEGKADGNAGMKDLLGGKGANLAEMINLGIPVPSGFTISTEVCSYYEKHQGGYPPELDKQVAASLAKVEQAMASRFGDQEIPCSSRCVPVRPAACRDDGYDPEPRA